MLLRCRHPCVYIYLREMGEYAMLTTPQHYKERLMQRAYVLRFLKIYLVLLVLFPSAAAPSLRH